MKTIKKTIPTHSGNLCPLPVGRGWGWVLLLLLAFSSCRDHFDIDSLNTEAKLVVYCFPSANRDTTWISVTNSVPVRKYTDTRDISNLAGARIIYKVNGEQREVCKTENASLGRTATGLDPTFYVLGRHRGGDLVSVSVACDGYPSATAETTVPEQAPVELQRVVTVREYDPEWYAVRDFIQLQASFTDPAASRDYYAVRVGIREYGGVGVGVYTDELGNNTSWFVNDYATYRRLQHEIPEATWSYEITDSTTIWAEIETLDEPLLNPLSSIDEDFGFENNFYGNFYIFSDEEINGQAYTLHLNIADSRHYSSKDYNWAKAYQVVLYRISPEYYRFLKSINDVDNNELAKGGFSQLMPTFSNVLGGIGVLGGFTSAQSEWKGIDEQTIPSALKPSSSTQGASLTIQAPSPPTASAPTATAPTSSCALPFACPTSTTATACPRKSSTTATDSARPNSSATTTCTTSA